MTLTVICRRDRPPGDQDLIFSTQQKRKTHRTSRQSMKSEI